MAYQYKPRTAADWDKRATASRFVNFYKDQYKTVNLKKDNWFRFCPPTWEDARHFGFDLWVHYSVGPDNGCVVCLYKMQGKPCPICEAQAKAEAKGDNEVAKSLKPVRRVLVWVIDRKDESQGPLLWAMPWTADRDLAKICKDRQTGELYAIDHPDAGFDVSFDREGELPNVKYVGWQLARRPSPVDSKVIDYILANPVPETICWRTYEEVAALFEGQPVADKGGDAPAPAPAQAPPQSQPQAAPPRAEAGKLCANTVNFRGELVACSYQEGHNGNCNFDRLLAAAPPAVAPDCPKTFQFRGQTFGCTHESGHGGECDFAKELSSAPAQSAPAQAPAQAPAPPPVESHPPAGMFDKPSSPSLTESAAPATPATPAAPTSSISTRAAALRSRFTTGK